MHDFSGISFLIIEFFFMDSSRQSGTQLPINLLMNEKRLIPGNPEILGCKALLCFYDLHFVELLFYIFSASSTALGQPVVIDSTLVTVMWPRTIQWLCAL